MTGLLTLVLLVQVPVAESMQGEDRYRIVYTVLMNDDYSEYEIFSMNPDGTDQRNISNSEGVDWAYAADGDRVWFVSDRDSTTRFYFLYEMDAFGRNVRKITDFRVPDAWVSSRNGGKELLVVQGSSYFTTDIWLINSYGEKLRRLTANDVRDTDPVFSPDGSRIAFRSARELDDPKSHEELWIMNADGSDARRLSYYPEGKAPPSRSLYKAGPPVWFPDGRWISFISHRDGRYNIYRIRPDGSGFGRLTDNDMPEGYHSWSPDGSRLAFDSDREGQYDIYLMKADGSGVRRLTGDLKYEQCPLFVRISD